MRSARLLGVAVLAVVLALALPQGAFATITSVSMNPACGPPGTTVELDVTATEGFSLFFNNVIIVECDFPSPYTHAHCIFTTLGHEATITIIEADESRVLTFGDCPAPVGGDVMPANMFAVLGPLPAVIGLVGCIGTAVVVAEKRFGS